MAGSGLRTAKTNSAPRRISSASDDPPQHRRSADVSPKIRKIDDRRQNVWEFGRQRCYNKKAEEIVIIGMRATSVARKALSPSRSDRSAMTRRLFGVALTVIFALLGATPLVAQDGKRAVPAGAPVGPPGQPGQPGQPPLGPDGKPLVAPDGKPLQPRQ